ncbi:DUF3307 domain-containing protein [Rhizobium oryzihabitans]|uniref:DUF3307 domain-containing protein n=1 Tax=Rhizobium oryzihabitans TaxID=2267833 RepID=A0A7L5BKH1_9HYPH|nr:MULTISPECIES: DUF3307 domain-containing protein [Rhizobium/Agrobacterium group]QIB39374.1 DUF3307 domain-containing protein [Rhizobium oryzihabitans]TQN59639.1 DUF3307 domain-containing protein [Agrobacterium tumefaciens]CDN96072.1 hypothetical protein BN949_05247 [Agrobacterium tumefaciens]
MHILEMLVYMIAAHFLLDYALQGDWMSKAKNATLDLVPGERIWPLALFGHALIHATAVQIITGNWWLFPVELIVHFITDYRKCRGDFGYNFDQAVHIGCKVLYAGALLVFSLIRYA